MIVGEEGIEALTVDRLSRALGLLPDEVRAHYATTHTCLLETYDEVSRSIYEDFAAAFASESGWRDGLRIARDTLLDRLGDRPHEARFCFVEVLRGDHELLRRRDASRRRLTALLIRELDRRCKQPEAVRMQLELLVGAGFQAIATAVDESGVARLPDLGAELESRARVFAPVAV